jgi:hypothetical protein
LCRAGKILLNSATRKMMMVKKRCKKEENNLTVESYKLIQSTNALKNNKSCFRHKTFHKYFLLPYLTYETIKG